MSTPPPEEEQAEQSHHRRRASDGAKIRRASAGKGGSMKGKKRELKSGKSFDHSTSSTQASTEEPIEMLTPKENGFVDVGEGGEGEEEKRKHTASIKGMWKKAFKSLKSNDKQSWLSKKGSLIRRKDSEEKEEPPETSKEIDPVYSLLKCAADLPKVPKSQKEPQCTGHLGGRGDSSGSTSKASSPSSSGVCPHSPPGDVPPGFMPGGATAAANSVATAVPTSPTSPSAPGAGGSSKREHMHHIVDESLGSEFRTFYKLTSPVKKSANSNFDGSRASFKKNSSNSKFEGTVKIYEHN